MFKNLLKTLCIAVLITGFCQQAQSTTIDEVRKKCSPTYSHYEELTGGLIKVQIGYYYGVINNYCRVVVPIQYTKIEELNSNILVESYSNYGLLDRSGSTIIPVNYRSIKALNSDYYQVEKDYLYGIIYKDGTIITEPYYLGISTLPYSMFAISSYDLNADIAYGLMSKTGYVIFQPQYKNIYVLSKGFFKVPEFDFYKIIDILGNEYFNSYYKNVEYLFGTYFKVKTAGSSYGVVNKKGVEIVKPQYDKIEKADDGYIKVKLNGKWGGLDGKWGAYDVLGNMVLPCQYGPIEIKQEIKKLPINPAHVSAYQKEVQTAQALEAYYHLYSSEYTQAKNILNKTKMMYADEDTKRILNVLKQTLSSLGYYISAF